MGHSYNHYRKHGHLNPKKVKNLFGTLEGLPSGTPVRVPDLERIQSGSELSQQFIFWCNPQVGQKRISFDLGKTPEPGVVQIKKSTFLRLVDAGVNNPAKIRTPPRSKQLTCLVDFCTLEGLPSGTPVEGARFGKNSVC